MLKIALITLCASLISGAALAAPLEINGVKVENSVNLAGTKLQLNGAGTLYKLVFKVYVGELYTAKKISNLDELVAAPGPKRLSMTFLRDVDPGQLGKLMTRGLEDNVPKSEMSKMVPGLIRMSEIFSANKGLIPGDVINLDWIPGTGMVVTVRGKTQGEAFKDPEFFKGMMSIWFGPNPGDWKLKDAMLGSNAASVAGK
jgi:hypothetical protein